LITETLRGHLSHSCIKTCRSSINLSIFSDILTELTKFFSVIPKRIRSMAENDRKKQPRTARVHFICKRLQRKRCGFCSWWLVSALSSIEKHSRIHGQLELLTATPKRRLDSLTSCTNNVTICGERLRFKSHSQWIQLDRLPVRFFQLVLYCSVEWTWPRHAFPTENDN